MSSIVASQKYLTIENYCSPRRNLLLPQTKFQRIAENEKSGSVNLKTPAMTFTELNAGTLGGREAGRLGRLTLIVIKLNQPINLIKLNQPASMNPRNLCARKAF
jgi:hypothetical protein